MHKLTGTLGLAAVLVFVVTFVVLGALTPDFQFVNDYISKLGSRGQPYADWWNTIGFGIVGVAFAAFGFLFGLCVRDRVLSFCLMVAGLGFAMAAVPTDFNEQHDVLSKAHHAAICFGLAGWCFGLARMTRAGSTDEFSRTMATYTITLSLLPMIAMGGGISEEPVAHRLVMLVVLTWVLVNSLILLLAKDRTGVAGNA
ncbi:MAG: DUF998 domain-containing protein [Planctomycetota bacterium]